MRRRRSARAPLYWSPAFRRLAESLGANVLRLRKARGWTQEQAAEHCEIAPRMLQAIEAGDVNATLVTLARLLPPLTFLLASTKAWALGCAACSFRAAYGRCRRSFWFLRAVS
jgi:transcriptional regulator with XRE-family HTH domain